MSTTDRVADAQRRLHDERVACERMAELAATAALARPHAAPAYLALVGCYRQRMETLDALLDRLLDAAHTTRTAR